ncbi:MAG: glycosyltransferase [Ilumatobacter sp.]|nr:glycosyltransferase [Ilumatobacter sp.]
MEPEIQQAPPVVAVIVVHEPGAWFDESLDALADQDYPNLRFLFLITSSDAELEERIRLRLPSAFVRSLGSNPGFGPAVNEVLRLVEGDKGFFLIGHDDIAPEPEAVRTLVEEIYRSNAGVVGPKLVEWDDPGVLQTVGLGVDRFGEIDQVIEPGELDQEQHDGVRDVFVLPSACMLVRADLFREIGGFDPSMTFHGDDVELCWRVHHSGARVVVAPSARVRHRGRLPERRPDLNHRLLQARHRMRAVATLTGPTRLPGRSVEMVLLTLVELVVGVFTGKASEAWASLRALAGLIPRTVSTLRRRKAVKPLRRVPEREVLGLQVRGSARVAGFLRSRETSTYVGPESTVRRWRESTTAPVLAWLGVLAAIAIGSRDFLAAGVPNVGEFLQFPASPRDLLDSYTSGWNSTGAGSTSANPTGWATLAGLSTLTLFRMGALHTLFIVGLIVVGLVGLWRLATVLPSTRGRIAALVVYAATPLVAGAMATGRLTTLIAYASTPWIVQTLRRAVGVETADPRRADDDLVDGIVALPWPERLRRVAAAAIVIGLAVAFAPVMAVVALVVAALLAVGTVLALAPWQTAVRYVWVGLAAVVGGVLLNFPWFTTWSWDQLSGPPPVGDPGRGLLDLASFQIGSIDFAAISLVLYLPVIAGVALARAWRLTWAIRAATLVVGFGFLAVLSDQGALPFDGPEAGVLLAPVAVGLAMSAAAALAAFDLDVRGGTFGWRQPLGILASISVVVGVFPGVVALADGDWGMPPTPLARLLNAPLPDAADGGDYNVLLLGDARLLPVPSTEYRDGLSFAIIDDGPLDFRDRWTSPSTDADDAVRVALDEMASSSTLRAGRLLAPLGIRFIVAPEFDNVLSTTADPLPLPGGLVDALEDQLDLTSVTGLTLEVFENSAWIPTFSALTGTTAEASRTAGAEALVRAELTSVSPKFPGANHLSDVADEVVPGVVHLAVPYDEQWELTIGGETLEPRRAFGVTTAFDVERSGTATLGYRTGSLRPVLLALQVLLWLVVLFAATRVSVPLARRTGSLVEDETLIDLEDVPFADGDDLDDDLGDEPSRPAIADPGLDLSGEISRAVEGDEDADEVSELADDGPERSDDESDPSDDESDPSDDRAELDGELSDPPDELSDDASLDGEPLFDIGDGADDDPPDGTLVEDWETR